MSNYTELLYVWVGCNKTGFIADQGFNFSPNYTFTLNEHQDGEIKLNCKTNEKYPNVWKDRNIVGLTALVGKNGTGKSTLMNCLLDPSAQERILLVYKRGNMFYIRHNLGDMDIRHDMDRQFVQQINQLEMEHNQIRISITNAMGSTYPVIDEQLDSLVFSPDTDISEYFETDVPRELTGQGSNRFYVLQNMIQCTAFDKLAILNYYKDWCGPDHNQKTLLTMNGTLNLSFSAQLQKLIRKLITKHPARSNSENREYLKNLQRFHKSELGFINPVEQAYLAICIEICYITDRWDIPPYNLYEAPVWWAQELSERYFRDPQFSDVAEYYQDAMSELHRIKEMFDKVGNARFSFEDDPETYTEFCDYIWNLTKKPGSFVLRYLTIDMPQLSSGEKALQNICAWLHLASDLTEASDSDRREKTLLLLLDEVDLYMHPEWQRKFLGFLSEELHNQFENRYIQIVLTTHSPLVLSDIPRGNIIYLKNEDCRCVIEVDEDFKESFGASIPALLRESFFMKETMGGFAKKKITDIVQVLENFRKNSQDPNLKEECISQRRTIDIVGDPIIKHKLQMRYQELMHPKSECQDPSNAVKEWIDMADSDQRRAMKQKILDMFADIDDN